MNGKILIVGALGQVGRELTETLREMYGVENVIMSDIKKPDDIEEPFEIIDVLDKQQLFDCVKKHNIKHIYNLAALLSATAEQNIKFAWQLTMEGLFNVLDLARDRVIDRVFWPSSIAVFGPNTPKKNTPQHTIIEPNTVYGIGKQAGEQWCAYYHKKFDVDVRSIRYPGLIGYKSLPGGGTTDYAVDIFYSAIKNETYKCFLAEDMRLPMMYMGDAIRATIDIMHAPSEDVKLRNSYNVGAMDFSPAELSNAIQNHKEGFNIEYEPDFRQQIASQWPSSVDDSAARRDWGWNHSVDLEGLVDIMMKNIKV